jgi:hypothetical protein
MVLMGRLLYIEDFKGLKMEQIIHEDKITQHPDWNESFYFVFYNKEFDIGGMSRIGFKPNKNEAMAFFFLFLPDGSAAGYHQEIKLKHFSNSLKVKGMIHDWHKNNSWSYKFDGNMIFVNNSLDLPKVREDPKVIQRVQKVKMDCSFVPLNEPYEYSQYMTKESLEIGKKAGDKHWEQIGLVDGILDLGDHTYEFNKVMGQRDHTYGVRDWTGVGNWLYYVIWFDVNLAVNPAAIVLEDGRLSTGGFIFKDGKNIPLKEIKIIDQQFQNDGLIPISSTLELIDNANEKYRLNARAGPVIPLPLKDEKGNESILIQSFGEFHLNDKEVGYGSFETLRKVI